MNFETRLTVNVHQRCFNINIRLKMSVGPTYVFRRCFNVEIGCLFYGYHNFTSIVSCQQSCFWCKPKFNVVSTLTSLLNQCWQYDVGSTLVSHGPTSQSYVNIYQRWNNVGCSLGRVLEVRFPLESNTSLHRVSSY